MRQPAEEGFFLTRGQFAVSHRYRQDANLVSLIKKEIGEPPKCCLRSANASRDALQ
ncbi:MAG TPA: hypothetical protein VMU19_08950 [Bryobacteraceae bacterium]|nr:hypothetical protein [Bryobacteraceae bacterium]